MVRVLQPLDQEWPSSCLSCGFWPFGPTEALILCCLHTSWFCLEESRSSCIYPDTLNSSRLSHVREAFLCCPVGPSPSRALQRLPPLGFLQGCTLTSNRGFVKLGPEGKELCFYMFGGLQHPAKCLSHSRCPMDTNGGSYSRKGNEWDFSLMAYHRSSDRHPLHPLSYPKVPIWTQDHISSMVLKPWILVPQTSHTGEARRSFLLSWTHLGSLRTDTGLD